MAKDPKCAESLMALWQDCLDAKSFDLLKRIKPDFLYGGRNH